MLDRLHHRTWFAIALCIVIAGIWDIHGTAAFLATARYADAARVSSESHVYRRSHGSSIVFRNVVSFTAADGHRYECELTTDRARDHYWIAYPPDDPSACHIPPQPWIDALTFAFYAAVPTLAGIVRMLAARRRGP